MFSGRCFSWLVVAVVSISSTTIASPSSDAVEKNEEELTIVYHGSIEENAEENDEVHLNIPILKHNQQKLNGDEVCGYTLYKWHSENPFKVVVLDRKTGEAKIVLSPGYTLDYEKKHRYNLEIAPYDCITGAHGTRAKLHIKVEDANEFAPIWKEHSYSGSVPEGKIMEEILKVSAVDADGSKTFSKICQFHLLTQDVPFIVSETGYLGNTRPLKYDDQSYYQLEVKAEDCGGLISDVAMIEIEVTPVCKARWTDVDGEVEVTGPMRQSIMPGASLDLCGSNCDVIQVSVTMEMQTSQIGRGCDRDVYSLQTNRKICGASLQNVDLLPSPAKSNSWTQELPTDGGLEANPIFIFDGKIGAVEIPEGIFTERNFGSRFSISTWMKRDKNPDNESPHGAKEHILCSADADGLNRHHSSLFVHNCRLILLLRQEPSDEDAEMLKPAEWRWMLPEVCDGKWHHYTINVNFPQVLLYLDGKLFIENGNNSETLEDWPLRQSVKDVRFTKFVVGACWQGAKHRMGQYFRGYLTALTFLMNETDDDEVIQCLNNCKEKLDVIGLDEMTTGMSVSMNSEMSRMTLNGLSVDSVEKMLHNVGYVNSRIAPTPGHRPVTIETIVKCADGNSVLVEDSNVTVVVHEADPINIVLNSTLLLSRQEQHLLSGERIFENLLIKARSKLYIEDQQEFFLNGGDQYLLDSCVVQVEPRLNIEVEYLAYPENLTEQLSLEVDSSEDGLVIAGADRLDNYQQLLRLVQFITSKPQDMNSKTFVLSCTELNGHFLSNQLRVTLEVIHVVHEKAPAPHAMMVNKAAHPVASHPAVSDNMRLIAKSFPSSLKYDSQESGVGVAVVMVVCIGFVVMLIVLGIMRVRNAQRYKGGKESGDRKQDGSNWDNNSSLTITVNPMDPDNMYEEEVENNSVCHDDEDDDSDDEDGIYSRSDVDMKKISNYGSIGSKSTLVL